MTKLLTILSTGVCFLIPPDEEIDFLKTEIEELHLYINELETENKRLVDTINREEDIETYYPEQPSVIKTFMDYRAITSRSSKQYHYRLNGETLPGGLRSYNDRIQIAIGKPYADVGDKVDIYMESGEIIRAIVADSKGDRFYHPDGSTIEFLVDSDLIPYEFRGKYGLDVKYPGYIEKLNVLK